LRLLELLLKATLSQKGLCALHGGVLSRATKIADTISRRLLTLGVLLGGTQGAAVDTRHGLASGQILLPGEFTLRHSDTVATDTTGLLLEPAGNIVHLLALALLKVSHDVGRIGVQILGYLLA
jgi:hypothetical protein